MKAVGALSLLAVLLAGNSARSEDMCPALQSLVSAIRQDAPPPQAFPDATECSFVRTLGGGQEHYCRWDYPFRSKDTLVKYSALNTAIRRCLDGPRQIEQDPDVNHPDTSSQIIYDFGTVTLRASIKDKAALQKTLVFLWIAKSD